MARQWTEEQIERLKETMRQPAVRERMSAAAKSLWADPKVRAARLAGMRSKRTRAAARATRARNGWSAKQSERMKRRWADPAGRAKIETSKNSATAEQRERSRTKMSASAKATWKNPKTRVARITAFNSPETRAKDKATRERTGSVHKRAVMLKHMWADPVGRAKLERALDFLTREQRADLVDALRRGESVEVVARDYLICEEYAKQLGRKAGLRFAKGRVSLEATRHGGSRVTGVNRKIAPPKLRQKKSTKVARPTRLWRGQISKAKGNVGVLPHIEFLTTETGEVKARGDDFKLTITKVRGDVRGYPQCEWMWHLQFHRGGCCASAFHEYLEGAKTNAARIVGHMRGTHDVMGNELNPDGTRLERASARTTQKEVKPGDLFATEAI